jgi:hypothetical protein
MQGYPINWGMNKGDTRILFHPLYIKYNNSNFDDITLADVQTDLGLIMATAESAPIAAFLCWLIRIKQLLV